MDSLFGLNAVLGSPGLGSPGLGSPGLGSPGLGSPGLGSPTQSDLFTFAGVSQLQAMQARQAAPNPFQFFGQQAQQQAMPFAQRQPVQKSKRKRVESVVVRDNPLPDSHHLLYGGGFEEYRR